LPEGGSDNVPPLPGPPTTCTGANFSFFFALSFFAPFCLRARFSLLPVFVRNRQLFQLGSLSSPFSAFACWSLNVFAIARRGGVFLLVDHIGPLVRSHVHVANYSVFSPSCWFPRFPPSDDSGSTSTDVPRFLRASPPPTNRRAPPA